MLYEEWYFLERLRRDMREMRTTIDRGLQHVDDQLGSSRFGTTEMKFGYKHGRTY